ncbi:hypothetical protein PBCV1_a621bL [Paramecium bursaria Chlorella virus 1]|uniref:Uncharacterized protein n=1 Tax=Paramecium bursaria Chlorella virus 1 TaxID=10506 RepID=F8TU71_PBCV1|nr:hypothetical protein PBCV1_a621bL [Paramecium bursaria Chlorella virus 1]AEI70132.1 hypothetical protein [Paramecium bursaria Chlorella virus 1]
MLPTLTSCVSLLEWGDSRLRTSSLRSLRSINHNTFIIIFLSIINGF